MSKPKQKPPENSKFSYLNKYRLAYVETAKAYADCHEIKELGFSNSDRNLNYFLMQEPVDGPTWIDIMTTVCPDGYNDFNKTSAEKLVELFGKDSEYYLARESSVCVYVKMRGGARLSQITDTVQADEVGITSLGMVRVWWD